MKAWRDRLIAAIVPGMIVSAGIIAWCYMLTGSWPPRGLLLSTSIGGWLGGLASPGLWGWIHRRTGRAVEPAEPESPA